MTNKQPQRQDAIGMVGLGVMMVGYDKDQSGSPANRGFCQRAPGRHRQCSHRRPGAGTAFRGWHNGYWVSKNTS
jgi:hypothetical protein